MFWSARWLRCAISRRIRADFAEIGGAAATGFFAAALAGALLATRAVAAVFADVDELPLEGSALRITLLAAGAVPAGVLTACSALTDRLDVLAGAGVRDGFTALVAVAPLSCLGAGDDFPLADLAAVAAAVREDDLPPGADLAAGLLLPAFEGVGLLAAPLDLAALVDKPAAAFVLLAVAAAGAAVFLADA